MHPTWPPVVLTRNAGADWFYAMGFNQAVFECKLAYDQHVEMYADRPVNSYLIAQWPRDSDTINLYHRNPDYLRGYTGGLLSCEQALTAQS